MRVVYKRAEMVELMFWQDKDVAAFTKLFLMSVNG
jgi:hypothetical protein